MLNVVKEQVGSALLVRLSGSIEESVSLDKLLGPAAPEMHVYCKEVTRINSVGVKGWIKYFSDAKAKCTQFKFFECAPAIVEQINLISNFTAGGTVESIYVPYTCRQCRAELLGLYKTEDLKRMNNNIPPLKCSKCGGMAEFDDIPEEYFNFLTR